MYPVDDPGALQYLCMGVAAQMTSSRYVSTKVPVEVIPRYSVFGQKQLHGSQVMCFAVSVLVPCSMPCTYQGYTAFQSAHFIHFCTRLDWMVNRHNLMNQDSMSRAAYMETRRHSKMIITSPTHQKLPLEISISMDSAKACI